ncbi:dihydropteroate synthase [Spirochaetota bacterium]
MKEKVKIMGILNVTPDSFYDGGNYYDKNKAIDRAFEIAHEGADYIDIGGESTRPGSEPISEQLEIDRVCPVIESVIKDIDIPISIDTSKSAVARAALNAGAKIVNDISGLAFDEEMAGVVAKHNAGLILMHIKGTPKDMQKNPVYDNLMGEIYHYLEDAVKKAIDSGIDESKIIIDPGIGFGKSLEDNYIIINNLVSLTKMGYPVLIGLSRKSLIRNLYENDVNRLPGTISLNIISILNGAEIIRVHDVKEHKLAMDTLKMLKKVS